MLLTHTITRLRVRGPLLHLVGLGWELRQVSRHGHLRDKGSELRELRVDTRCAPAIVSHGPDEPANLAIYSRSSRITSPRNPCPVSSELIPIPTARTVSALTMTKRLAHPGHVWRSATQNARVRVVEGRLGRSLLERSKPVAVKVRFFNNKIGSATTHRPGRTGSERDEEDENTEYGAAKFALSRVVISSAKSALRPALAGLVTL